MAAAMADANADRTCENGCPNCQGDEGMLTAGVRICGQCCLDHLTAGEAADTYTCAQAMLKAHEGGAVVCSASGADIADWSAIKSEAKHDTAMEVVGGLLPSEKPLRDVEEPYPRQKRGGEGRVYANALHVHVYAAVVSFIKLYHRKPRGEEMYKVLDNSWGMYNFASGEVRPYVRGGGGGG